MGTAKTFRYPVSTRRISGRLLRLDVRDKPKLFVATPPEFGGGIPEAWSPEDLFVGSVAACFELTLIALAERRRIPLRSLKVHGTGHLEHSTRESGYGFTVIELDAELATDSGFEERAARTARLAKEHCIVGRALDTPLHLRLHVHTEPVDMPIAV